jgi:cobalamin biosynthesis protein CobD/CbiB
VKLLPVCFALILPILANSPVGLIFPEVPPVVTIVRVVTLIDVAAIKTQIADRGRKLEGAAARLLEVDPSLASKCKGRC